MNKCCMVLAVLLAGTVSGEDLVIQSFDANGTITFNAISNASEYRLVEEVDGTWTTSSTLPTTGSETITASVSMVEQANLHCVEATVSDPAPDGMVLIPGGSNSGTNPLGTADGMPESHDSCFYPATYSLSVGSFYMDRYEVTNDKMVQVMQWAYDHNPPLITVSASAVKNAHGDERVLLELDDTFCRITWDGSNFGMKIERGSGYPCVEVTWYGAACYCNYLSEMEGRMPCYNLNDWRCDFGASGYRLPTSTEWEYAARGGLVSQRFPWGDTISDAQARYSADSKSFSYDLSDGGYRFPGPVGAFPANAYDLCDMAGNVFELCYDWHPCTVGSRRVIRGGCCSWPAQYSRVGHSHPYFPDLAYEIVGFRAVRTASQ